MNVRKEIGSEFWSVPLAEEQNGYFSDAAWFLSGRSALEAIIGEIKAKRLVRTAWLPSWCCDSMILPFLKQGIDVKFYPVFLKDGSLVQDLADVKCDEILFLMDYFGYAGSESAGRSNGIVIRDVTHSVFSNKYDDADYYFGSLRKWCAFKTGGFALGMKNGYARTDEAYVSLRERAIQEKAAYMRGQSDSKDFLQIFAQAEDHLEECAPARADLRDTEQALFLDVSFLRAKRRENAVVLLEALADFAIFQSMGPNDSPLFVPVIIPKEKRDALRRYLIEKEIYLPVHWPVSKYHRLDAQTIEIYEGELSFVCDQRYDTKDMERIIEAVNQFMKR